MPKPTRKKFIEDLDPVEFVAVLDEGGRKFTFRVASGGHDISRQAQERRLPRALENARRVAGVADVVYFLDNAGQQHRLVATVCEGMVTFMDPPRANWLGRATAGLPRAPSLVSRDEALRRLREAERLSDRLRARESETTYSA